MKVGEALPTHFPHPLFFFWGLELVNFKSQACFSNLQFNPQLPPPPPWQVCVYEFMYASPLCLWSYFEGVVGGVASLLVPVLQLDAELVLASGGEGMQRCIPQPVLSLWRPKALPVFLPCPVEVHRAIPPTLEHCPSTARSLHVTFSLHGEREKVKSLNINPTYALLIWIPYFNEN